MLPFFLAYCLTACFLAGLTVLSLESIFCLLLNTSSGTAPHVTDPLLTSTPMCFTLSHLGAGLACTRAVAYSLVPFAKKRYAALATAPLLIRAIRKVAPATRLLLTPFKHIKVFLLLLLKYLMLQKGKNVS